MMVRLHASYCNGDHDLGNNGHASSESSKTHWVYVIDFALVATSCFFGHIRHFFVCVYASVQVYAVMVLVISACRTWRPILYIFSLFWAVQNKIWSCVSRTVFVQFSLYIVKIMLVHSF